MSHLNLLICCSMCYMLNCSYGRLGLIEVSGLVRLAPLTQELPAFTVHVRDDEDVEDEYYIAAMDDGEW
jgi:hypothetical protein